MKKTKFFLLFIFAFMFLSACTSSYTISFPEEDLEQIVVDKGEKLELDPPTKEGYDFKGWFTDSNLTTEFDDTKGITEDLSLYAKWENKKYEVRFLDGSVELAKVTVEHGKNATAPADPEKEGFTFKSWDKEFTNVTKNLVVYAQFETITFEVKFVIGDEEEIVTVDYGMDATAPSVEAPTGYTFKGWDKEFTNVKEDLVVTAEFEKITFTVKFVDKDGTELKSEVVNYGEAATAPANPTQVGYTFKEWSTSFDEVKSNLVVMATYDAIEYEIEYYDGDTKLTLTPNKYTIEDEITFPEYEKSGFLFVGWYLNNDFSGEIMTNLAKGETGKVVLYAKVLDESDTLSVNYELNGGKWGWDVVTVTNGAAGIDAVSELPEMFMLDFYKYLVDNDLLTSSVVDSGLHKTTWADFSKSYDDPVAIYNWGANKAYGGLSGDTKGYNQFFYDSGTGNSETGEAESFIGGFFGSDEYGMKYMPLVKHVGLIQYSRDDYGTGGGRLVWSGPSSKTLFGFILDGYFYGTQGFTGRSDEFKQLRGIIPTPDENYPKEEYINGLTFRLPVPSKSGMIFEGWYDNEGLTGEKIVEIPAGETPATKYYAKWVDPADYN